MRISVITVCYNAEKTIEETIKSVVNQTYKNIEYIIVDGASTDGTMSIIEKYKDNIEVLLSEPDEGIYDAMNKGIEMASGEYIGFLNADDWYQKNAIENVVNIAQSTSNDVGVISGQINILRNNFIQRKTNHSNIEDIWKEMPLAHPATFVKKSVFNDIGKFDLSLKISADYDFVFRCYLNKVNISYSELVFANFRIGGVSTTNHRKVFEEDMNILNRYKKHSSNLQMIEDGIMQKRKRLALYELDAVGIMTILESSTDLYIWGCGYWGNEVRDVLDDKGIKVKGMIDNNEEWWGKSIGKCIVQKPAVLKDIKGCVLIAVKNGVKDIHEQIVAINESISIVELDELMTQAYEKMKGVK